MAKKISLEALESLCIRDDIRVRCPHCEEITNISFSLGLYGEDNCTCDNCKENIKISLDKAILDEIERLDIKIILS